MRCRLAEASWAKEIDVLNSYLTKVEPMNRRMFLVLGSAFAAILAVALTVSTVPSVTAEPAKPDVNLDELMKKGDLPENVLEYMALRNGSLQGAYFILAARALGLDCGPMSGFNNARVDAAFFAGTTVKSNFLCNVGYGDAGKLYPRSPRLSFEEACKVV